MASFFFEPQVLDSFLGLSRVGGVGEPLTDSFEAVTGVGDTCCQTDVEICHEVQPSHDVFGSLIPELNHRLELFDSHVQAPVVIGIEEG